MRRGDLAPVALQGDYGTPRPALVIQSDLFPGTASGTVLPVTSELVEAPLLRLTVDPSAGNGLREVSQVMVDKAATVRADRLVPLSGALTTRRWSA